MPDKYWGSIWTNLYYSISTANRAHLISQVLTIYTVKLICYKTAKDHLHNIWYIVSEHLSPHHQQWSPTYQWWVYPFIKMIMVQLYHSSILDIQNFWILTKVIEGDSALQFVCRDVQDIHIEVSVNQQLPR